MEDFNEFMDAYFARKEEELQKFADVHGIKNLDLNIIRCLGNVRRPLVLVRGKSITVEEVKKVITGEEPLFGEGADCNCYFDPRGDRGILKNIFYRQGYDWLSTWVYSDGTIGGNLIFLGKYPCWDEMILPYMHLAERYPFLDIVVSYTIYDECCCYFCRVLDSENEGLASRCGCKDCQPYLDKIVRYSWCHRDRKYNREPDFEELYFRSWETGHVRSDAGDLVVLTIWIHNGRTYILFVREAADKYREYDELYCAPEYAFMFSSELYSSDRTCICSKAFVEDCFEYI